MILPKSKFDTFNNKFPLEDWIMLNFNNTINDRRDVFSCIKINKYQVGLNSLANRFTVLNGKIPLQWLNLSKIEFKLRCKDLFLKTAG